MKIPTHEDAFTAIKDGTATALDRFVYAFEPASRVDEQAFRAGLAEVLALARKTIFPATHDTHVIPGRGTVHFTTLLVESSRSDFEQLQGKIVTLGDRPFLVRGVESRCVETQHAGWPIGLLGEFLP